VNESALDELLAALPADAVVVDPATVENHRRDRADLCPAGAPLALVRPRTTEQVQVVMRWATRHRVPVVPQGARTGLSGGANAVDGCLLLSLARMDAIVEIDPLDQVAVVEPGVVNAVLSQAALDAGLYYPPDPSSWGESTIGGNIATNAGGLCCSSTPYPLRSRQPCRSCRPALDPRCSSSSTAPPSPRSRPTATWGCRSRRRRCC
jgi:glycolate oxidase